MMISGPRKGAFPPELSSNIFPLPDHSILHNKLMHAITPRLVKSDHHDKISITSLFQAVNVYMNMILKCW